MYADPAREKIDWDGLFTLLLTFSLILITLGLPVLAFYLYALRIARSQPGSTQGVDNLFVFGKKLSNEQQIDAEYKRRLDRALRLITDHPQIRLILLGGPSAKGGISEARAGLDYLLSRGMDKKHRIQLEERSRNTLENLRHAQQILFPEGTAATPIMLVTNRYHLARSAMIAGSLGFKPVLSPAEPGFPGSHWDWGKLLKEAFFMLWFQTGKGWARLIGSQRMLDRVT
jgi:uncharacterized SAM-binding protein YcdF (DUF218 family)